MKKQNRIRKNEEFQKIISKKNSVANQSFVVYFQKNNLNNQTRVGISVSKKLGNAVLRNKIKRQVRMLAQQTIDFNDGFDYIIIVRNKFLSLPFSKNEHEMDYILKKIKKKVGS